MNSSPENQPLLRIPLRDAEPTFDEDAELPAMIARAERVKARVGMNTVLSCIPLENNS